MDNASKTIEATRDGVEIATFGLASIARAATRSAADDATTHATNAAIHAIDGTYTTTAVAADRATNEVTRAAVVTDDTTRTAIYGATYAATRYATYNATDTDDRLPDTRTATYVALCRTMAEVLRR